MLSRKKIDTENTKSVDELSSLRDKLSDIEQARIDADFEKLDANERLLILEEKRRDTIDKLNKLDEGNIDGLREKVRLEGELDQIEKDRASVISEKADKSSDFSSFVEGIRNENQTAEELYQERIDTIESYWEDGVIPTEAEYHAASLEAFKSYEQAKTDEAEKQSAARKQIQDQLLISGLEVAQQAAELVSSAAEEGTKTQKAAFLTAKGLAIAQAIINTELGATAALKYGPEGEALATAIRIQGYASVALIAAQTAVDMKEHGGLIGSGQTAIVGEAGPEFVRGPAYVTSARTTEAMMSSGAVTTNSASNTVINVTNNAGRVVNARAQSKRGQQGEIIDVTINELVNRIQRGDNTAAKTFDKLYKSNRGRV